MSRRRVVDAPRESYNELARRPETADALRRCFGADILPARRQYPRRFHQTDVSPDLYMSEREWVDPVQFGEHLPLFRHEAYLDELFWSRKREHRKIFLLGNVGCGKSTLIDFYLRCHCPNGGSHQEDFDQKLVLHIDLLDVGNNSDLFINMFHTAQAAIIEQSEARGFDVRTAVARRTDLPAKMNVREWVLYALKELSRPSSSFSYVVVVIDNLDQSPAEVQKRAIGEVDFWLKQPDIRLWRVFIPMWPSTLNRLRNSGFDPMRHQIEFKVGPVLTHELVRRRQDAVERELLRSNPAQMPELYEYLRGIFQLAHPRLTARVRQLTNGDLRRKLRIWESFVSGELAHEVWARHRANPDSRRTYDYELLDALLTGTYDVFNPGHLRVANVLALGHATQKPRDMLIGPHALHFLKQGTGRQQSFRKKLGQLGYVEDNVESVEHNFYQYNVLHEVPSAGDLGMEFEIHTDVVEAYLQLLIEPAYVDNVALITHVDPEFHARMTKTRGDRPDHFPSRVETTIAFLEFLRANEEAFCDTRRLRSAADPAAFRDGLRAAQLPCLWKKMALRYLERLNGLRLSSYLRQIPSTWWDEVTASPVFSQAAEAPDELVPVN